MSTVALKKTLDDLAKNLAKTDFVRNMMAREAQDIEFKKSQMAEELKDHYFNPDDENGQHVTLGEKLKREKKKNQTVIEDYVEDALIALTKGYGEAESVGVMPSTNMGAYLRVIAFKHNPTAPKKSLERGTKNPYKKLSDIKSAVLNDVVKKNQRYRDFFWGGRYLSNEEDPQGNKGALKASQFSMGSAIHLGHKHGVSIETATALGEALPDQLEAPKNMTPEQKEAFKAVNEKLASYKIGLGKYAIGLDDVTFKFDAKGNPVFKSSKVYLLAEGQGENVDKKEEKWYQAGPPKEDGGLPKDFPGTKKGLLELINVIADFYKENAKYLTMPGSPSVIERARNSLVSPRVRKLSTKKSKAFKKTPKKETKKPKPRITSNLGTAVATVKSVRGAPLESTGSKVGAVSGQRKTTVGGNSFTSLIALLNQKLPDTVARNMGPPGLQNQTGTFASGVKVTDVTRTAQGYPSVGYTYQKNPYQVFEMGKGDPRWATKQRDPRGLIDSSIREIAAQLAIGRFYTRRI